MAKCYILGAGLTGLTAAYKLQDKFSEVKVFEQKNYLGGICQTHKIEGINYEYGPHILYTTTEEQKKFWLSLVANNLFDYYVRCSIDGKVGKYEELYDFPISNRNLTRLGVSCSPQPPDYSNFENYMISQIGLKAYQTFVKNYNIKQWGIPPSQMSAEWAKGRPLSLKEDNPKMFGNKWAGHPGSYRHFFEKLSHGSRHYLNLRITGAKIEDNLIKTINCRELTEDKPMVVQVAPDDLVINTLPIDLFFKGELSWRGIRKVFVVLDRESLMPTYSTTFPNNYPWTRIIEYPKHSGQKVKGKSLISFALPYGVKQPLKPGSMEEIDQFIDNEIKATELNRRIEQEDNIYPISSHENLINLDNILAEASKINNFITIGRLGLYAYISMSRAVEMVFQLSQSMEDLNNSAERLDFYQSLRKDLW